MYDGDGIRVARLQPCVATYLFMGGKMPYASSGSIGKTIRIQGSLRLKVSVEIPTGTVTDTKSYSRTLRWGFAFGSNTAAPPHVTGLPTVAGQVVAVRDTDGLNVILTDHLGSILGEVDGLGALVGEQRYLPFGEVREDFTTISSTDLSFTGQRSLLGTGLIDYHARQYDPSLRSFILPDSVIPNPYGVQDYNRYSYVQGNPMRFTDPSGKCIQSDGNIDWNSGPYGTSGLCTKDTSENRSPQNVDIWDPAAATASQTAVELIKAAEVSSSTSIFTPYNDLNGYCTVGYGHILSFEQCTDNQLTVSYSEEEINGWLAYDLFIAEKFVRKTFQDLDNEVRPVAEGFPPGNPIPLSQTRFDALVSFAYNAGGIAVWNVVMGSAETIHGSQNGKFNYVKFSTTMLKYTSPGITTDGVYYRRTQEINWFVTNTYPDSLIR